MSEGFNIPALPFDKLRTLVQAYGRNDKPKNRDELAAATGFNALSISKSNSFLVDLGIISAGQSKSPTEIGRKLSREIQFENEDGEAGI